MSHLVRNINNQIAQQFNDLKQKLAVSESKINNYKQQIQQLDSFIEENKSIEQEHPNQVEKVNNLTFELSSVQLAIEKLREVSASIRKLLHYTGIFNTYLNLFLFEVKGLDRKKLLCQTLKKSKNESCYYLLCSEKSVI